jgi:hypothetical protein
MVEAQFEPGSRRRVLRNNLGIRSSRAMDVAEAKALAGAYRQVNISKGGLPFAGLPPLDFWSITDGAAFRGDYRAERCRDLSDATRPCRFSVRAMVSGFLPVSTEVLVATFVIRPARRLLASRR